MENARKAVKKFKKEYGIKGNPTSYEIKEVIKKFGFIPCGYHEDEEKLHETNTYDFSTERPAFAYSRAGKKYIFYNDLLIETDMARTLAHEVAHLYYDHLHRHTNTFDTPINKEWEANLFAAYLMEEKNYKYYLKKSILPLTLVVSSFFCGTLLPQEPAPTIPLPQEQAVTTSVSAPAVAADENITTKQDQVYVAARGTVYHISNTCSYIKWHDGIRKMTLESAEDANLPLCSRCKSKMKNN